MEGQVASTYTRHYRERKILVSVDEAEQLRCCSRFACKGRRDIYPLRPLEYRTLESLSSLS
jgi:hypothetical protein